MKKIKVRIKFTEPVLGGTPMNQEIYRDFIASKAPEGKDVEDEFEYLEADDQIQKGKTTFPQDDNGQPFLWDYHIKGFLKSACHALRTIKGTKSSAIKAYKKVIDENIFVEPRMIYFENAEPMRECQRPLRAQTPLGERVALAISDEIPAGAEMEFTISAFNEDHEKVILEWLRYGEFNGLCQWRNSGKGRFKTLSVEVEKEKGFWE